ncbi:hypothetical protein LSPH24S_09050 [Lysinibacillus sphaericus]
MHVKKGDKVKVITGKDKGKEGVILAAFPKQDRVLVEGVNIVKKHVKPNQLNPQRRECEPRGCNSRFERNANGS